jgi:hypothetical protein
MTTRRFMLLTALITSLLSTGCATVDVRLTAYRTAEAFPQPQAQPAVAVVVSTVDAPELLADEVAGKVMWLLAREGYQPADPAKAEHVLHAVIGIDAGRIAERRVPETESTRVYRSYYYSRGAFGHGRRTAVRTTVVPPQTYYRTERYREFTKQLRLALHAQPPTGAQPASDEEEPPPPLDGPLIWECTATATGPSDDLRWIANHLLLASFRYFGQDTPQQVTVALPWEGDAVRELVAAESAAEMPRGAGESAAAPR